MDPASTTLVKVRRSSDERTVNTCAAAAPDLDQIFMVQGRFLRLHPRTLWASIGIQEGCT
jgi:hypothetical protein